MEISKIKMINQNSKINYLFLHFTLSFCVFIFAFYIFAVNTASAATLYFSPSSGNFSVGNILTTSVLVNTQSQAINNSSAIINFPADLLEVVSVSKSGSIFSLWVEEPAFSNIAGTISFDGGLPTPGFNGTAGKIVNIVFRIRNTGAASLVFSSGAVRANDGLGTDILTSSGNASFSIKTSGSAPSAQESEAISTSASGGPSSPEVVSETHPNSNKWYSNPDPVFKWSVPQDVNALQTLAGQYPDSVPTVLYRALISEKEVKDMPDGIWYFHIRFKNSDGWSKTTHFRFQIDTEKPNRFSIKEVKRDDMTNPRVSFEFDAKDEMSGIDHYEIVIDDKEKIIWKDNGNHIYTTQALNFGKHTIVVNAVDAAGNTKEDSAEFSIDPLSPPKITEYPSELQKGEDFIIKGTTYPKSKVTIHIQKQKEEKNQSYVVNSDDEGKFILDNGEKLETGIYHIWAEVTDERGVASEPTEKVIVVIKPQASSLGDTQLISILIFIVLLVIVWYIHNTFILIRKKLRKEVDEAKNAVHKAFDLLYEEMQEHIAMLENVKRKRILTEEEEEIIRRFKKNLKDAEKFIEKEIKDIEKELK